MEELVEKHVLKNAYDYGAAKVDAVAKRVFSENPDLRSNAPDVIKLIERKIEEVNKLPPEEIRRRLELIAPELLVEVEREEVEKKLPDIPHDGPVVMRFAPNPNGAAHLGAARGIVVNAEYVRRYGGKFILRFDDTDPATKKPLPEAYDWYIEDCRWLGVEPDLVICASERIEKYYEYAEKLIMSGNAYVCTCTTEWFRNLRDAGQECRHRSQSPDENLKMWKNMLANVYGPGEAVLRIKTNMQHPDPAVRDWVAFRIIRASHPKVERKYVVWPTLDFESAIEDHLLGVTHIIRGKDLADCEKRQKYIYDYFGWKYPMTILWGKLKVHEFGKLSTSAIRSEIESGKYSGWDDPRIPTLRALRRRGIAPQAIWKLMISLGLGENDVAISMENLYAENRKIVDPIANRYFFVWDPVEIQIDGPEYVELPVHPDKDETRRVAAGSKVLICKCDVEGLKEGDRIRLKGLCNVEIVKKDPLQVRVCGTEMERELQIIQWVSSSQNVRTKVIAPHGEISGLAEVGVKKEVDRVIQFERFGFVRIDGVKDDEVIAYWTHD